MELLKCLECNKEFKKYYLKKHMSLVHNLEYNYDKTNKQTENIIEYRRNYYNNNKDNYKTCPYCEIDIDIFNFTNHNKTKKHIINHLKYELNKKNI